MTRTGAAQLAIQLGAASCDHLEHVNSSDIAALAKSRTVATLLPGCDFHLGLRNYAPARKLIDAGAIVALATDYNPGTSPTVSVPMILSLACSQLRMTPAEAITAATINAASCASAGQPCRFARGWQIRGPRRLRCGRLPRNSLLFWCEYLLDDNQAGCRGLCRQQNHNLTRRRSPSRR